MTEDLNLTQSAYVTLREDIISCRIKPDERLNIAKLQKELNTNQSAIREALSRLSAEGLAVVERNYGFRASPVAITGYRELAFACCAIETPCIELALQRGDDAWEGNLLSSYHVASKALKKVAEGEAGLDSYANHREKFHRILLGACGNHWLMAAWSLLYPQHMRFRHIFSSLARFEVDLQPDYQDFIAAVLARDTRKALAIWQDNHEKVTQFIEDSLKTLPQD